MINRTSVIALLLSALVLTPAAITPVYADEATIAKGKEVAYDRRKGNCLACHAMDDGTLPGNQGPPLMAMQARFPDKAVLRAQIYDPLERNPNTIMPPFGVHNILTDEEIDAIVEYLLTL